MVNLALWLKDNNYSLDQVQTFYPSPMSLATAMYHSEKNPLKKVTYKSDSVRTPRDLKQRRFQKAVLRYHDQANWDMLREEFIRMGRKDLIGNGPKALVPFANQIKGGAKARPVGKAPVRKGRAKRR